MKNVLVTGANGQLGQCVQKIKHDYQSLKFDFLGSDSLDISNAESITKVFSKKKYDYCINCAAYTNVEEAEKSPKKAFRVNAEGVKLISKACLKHNTVLIHISTDYVFDGEKETGYLPSDSPNPINEYGKSKLQGELYVQEILREYLIIRTSWLYSEYGKNFYKTIIKKAKVGEDLYITDEQKGCPTNANNLAKFIVKVLVAKKFESGIRHFTDGAIMTWFEFAEKIINDNQLGGSIKLVRDKNYRTFAKRPKFSILNN